MSFHRIAERERASAPIPLLLGPKRKRPRLDGDRDGAVNGYRLEANPLLPKYP